MWECESGIIISNGQIIGTTSHFTEFSVLIGEVKAPQVNPFNIDDLNLLNEVDESTICICILFIIIIFVYCVLLTTCKDVLSFIVFIYLVGLFFTIRSDRRRRRKEIMKTFSQQSMLSDIPMTPVDVVCI